MTIKEAIKHLQTYSTTMGSVQTTDEQHNEAKRMAIEALSRGLENAVADSCPEKPNESDLIRRADIEWHDYFVADGNGMYHNEKIAYKSQIDTLPSAPVTERARGEWIFNEEYGYYECSECRGLAEIDSVTGDYRLSNYCGDCGADMRKEN